MPCPTSLKVRRQPLTAKVTVAFPRAQTIRAEVADPTRAERHTEFEIMAITGHQASKEVTRYTKAASQKIRAASALVKMTAERN